MFPARLGRDPASKLEIAMDELGRLCVRILGAGEPARAAAEQAREADGRIAAVRAAVIACRERAAGAREEQVDAPSATAGSGSLVGAVSRELAAATSRLSQPEREALTLRELLGLPYAQIAEVTGTAPGEVALRLASARLALRAELRGAGEPQPTCDEYERALRTIASRQDGESVPAADGEWLLNHLGHCGGCGQAHASMLEATACYRAWRPEETPSTDAEQAAPSGAGA